MITWLDKIDGLDLGDPQKNVNAADMNQIKNQHNALETNVPVQITAAVNGVLGGAPGNLNTLGELAQAINNDPDFYNTLVALLALKANIANPTFTTGIITPLIQITGGSPGAQKVLTSDTDGHGTWVATDAAPTNGSTNLVRSDGVYDSINGVISDMALKAPIASPTFTGTVSGITKTMVGLGNVDNTSDATKLAAALAMFVWGEVPSGAINDINDTYTITNTAQKLAVYRNGLRQNTSSYTFTPGTNTFVMSVAPETGDTLLTDYQK